MNHKLHLSGMNGLRAFAIIGIVLYHILPEYFPGGYLGVNGFFIMMGYLMIHGAPQEFSVVTYYKRRIKRLYPALLIVLSLFIAAILILRPDYPKGLRSEIFSIVFGYNNWWQIVQNASYFDRILNSSPFTHLWYFGLTVQYYLLFPPVFLLGRAVFKKLEEKKHESGRFVVVLVLLILTVISALETVYLFDPRVDPSRVYYGTDTRAFALFLGMAMGTIRIPALGKGMKRGKIVLWALSLFSLICMVFMYLTVHGESAANYRGMMQFYTLLFALLFTCILLHQKRIGKIYDMPVIRTVGELSYEIYLVMYPSIWFVKYFFAGIPTIPYLLICIVLITVLAVIVHGLTFLLLSTRKLKRTGKAVSLIAGVGITVLCFSLTQYQTVRASKYSADMEELKLVLEQNEKLLKEQEAEQKARFLTEQISSILVNVDDETLRVTGQQVAEENPNDLIANGVTAIGDSVMLGAVPSMQEMMPGIYISAAQNRRIMQGMEEVEALKMAGHLGSTVVIHLGTNGAENFQTYQNLVDAVGPEREIYWVNAKGTAWAGDVITYLIQLCAVNPNVHYVDWNAYSLDHPEWFYSDGIHLNIEGQEAYAAFIKESIGL